MRRFAALTPLSTSFSALCAYAPAALTAGVLAACVMG